MTYHHDQISQVLPRIREMFRISAELGQAFPGRKFTFDGHLVGSVGEVLAAYFYGLKLLRPSAQRHDATAPDGRMVQIKATQGTGHIALRSEPDHLIILGIKSDSGEALEIYNGPGAPVWAACGKYASNGTRPIGMRKLQGLAEQVPMSQRVAQVHPVDRLRADIS